VAVGFWLTRSEDTVAISTTTTTLTGTQATTTTTEASDTTVTTGATATTATTSPSGPVTGDVSAEGSWTVMVYGVGDNNLEEDLLTDMKEMRAITGDVSDLTFMVLADRADGFTDESLGILGDWTSAKLVRISGADFIEIDDWGERNLGEAFALEEFMTAAVQEAPADHYAMILWDHGSMTGIGADESHSDVLEGWEIAVGLETGLAATGIDLDFIGFDACLMASLEVAAVVAPYASYMIASEELEPNDGWAYEGFGYLGQNDPTVVGLGTSILEAYHAASAPGDPTVTLSMLDLRRYDDFAAAMTAFTNEALATIDTSAVEIGRRRNASSKFGADPDPLQDWFMVDLGQLLRKVGRSDAPVADEARAAAAILRQFVVANITGDANKGATGISVHFPPRPEDHFPNWYEAFGDPVWADFLNGYFAAGSAIPRDRQAAVVKTSADTSFLFDDYGLELTAEIAEGALDTVVSAVLWSGVPEADGSVTFYSSDEGLVEGRLAVGFYDLTQLILSDGEDEAIAFQQLSVSEDLTIVTMTVPLWYRAPIDPRIGEFDEPIDVTLKVTYNLDTDEFTEELFASSLGTVGAFTTPNDGLFFPKVPYRDADGVIEWVATTDVGLWSGIEFITYDFVDMPSGTPLFGELIVSDFGGNTASYTATTEIP
jgi:hypothetical protein